MTRRVGVLALSYGTPASRDAIGAYYTRIRHGSAPTDAQLADLERRYEAIGGLSPLTERTAEQVSGVASVLARRAPGRYDVRGATKYADPSIEDVVSCLVADGVTELVGLVLAPLSAPMSTGQYHDRVVGAAGSGVTYHPIWAWWDAPGFAELVARRVSTTLDEVGDDATVLFTAHSLPSRVVAEGSDYPEQLAAAAQLVAARAGVDRYVVCWQSAGRTGDDWLGPDLLEVVSTLDAASAPAVVVCPLGFVSDHLEVLYDVDVDARRVAGERGIALRRTPSLNDDPAFLEVLANLIEGAAEEP